MKSILVISELCNYMESVKYHYSLTKGFYVAEGFSNLAKTYYLTIGESISYNNINLININSIDDEFLNDINFILFIREGNLLEILDENKAIEKVLFNKNRKQIIGMKSDTISWLYSKDYRREFPKKYNIQFIDFCVNTFDIMCCQTEEYKNIGMKSVMNNSRKYFDIIEKKVFISRMGVPNKSPLDNNIKNPYNINHSYCCDYFVKLQENKALHPVCYTGKGAYFNPNGTQNYNTEKTKLVYMGRIKIDDGKIGILMKEIMKKLGEEYELHIFPGRFQLPDCDVSVFSPKFPCNLQLLRDSIFFDCKNVIIHFPFGEKNKTKFLQHIDIAIDFSQARPKNEKSPQGNAKLLEYCYYGLKVVTEKNVNNSHLVESAKNGILLDDIGNVDDYVEAIKKVRNINCNKINTINITIKNNNWDLIASELYDKFVTLYE